MSVSFFEFLKTGELGTLKIGLHRDDVYALLGEPDDYADLPRWVYNRRNFQSHYYQRDKPKIYALYLWIKLQIRYRFSKSLRYQYQAEAGIWRYKNLEIGFTDNSVRYFYIANFDLTNFRLRPKLEVSDYFPQKGITIEAFEEFLDVNNLTYKVIKPRVDFELRHIIIENRISAYFNDDSKLTSILCSKLKVNNPTKDE